jgi:hypothetical protein
MTMRFTNMRAIRNIGLGVLALLSTLPLIHAERQQVCGERGGGGGEARGGGGGEARGGGGGMARSEPARMPAERSPAFVERADHGSIRHLDTNVYQRPAAAAPNFAYQQRAATTTPNAGAQQRFFAHRDVDADVNVRRNWSDFSFGARRHGLRAGYVRLLVNNRPYFYDDGIYYQQYGDVTQDNDGSEDADYQEVYPPVGAEITALPDGAIEVDAGDATYYYAAGAFYVQQQDGSYIIVASPIGVVVPELPPGAVAVQYGNGVAYQFNGTFYQAIFVNGVTQYVTVAPNA